MAVQMELTLRELTCKPLFTITANKPIEIDYIIVPTIINPRGQAFLIETLGSALKNTNSDTETVGNGVDAISGKPHELAATKTNRGAAEYPGQRRLGGVE